MRHLGITIILVVRGVNLKLCERAVLKEILYHEILTISLFATLSISVVSVGASWGADYQKGMAAGNRGDFDTAIRELSPLAENGHADSQFALVKYFIKD